MFESAPVCMCIGVQNACMGMSILIIYVAFPFINSMHLIFPIQPLENVDRSIDLVYIYYIFYN